MVVTGTRSSDAMETSLWQLFRAIATGDNVTSSRLLAASPTLASEASPTGATRSASTLYYFKEIGHYVYAGHTALHVAAAAYQTGIAKELLANGSDISARKRRGVRRQPGSGRRDAGNRRADAP